MSTMIRRNSWVRLLVSPRQDGILTAIALEPYAGREEARMSASSRLRVPVRRLTQGEPAIVQCEGEFWARAIGVAKTVGYAPSHGWPTRVVRREGAWWMRWTWRERLGELDTTQDCGGR